MAIPIYMCTYISIVLNREQLTAFFGAYFLQVVLAILSLHWQLNCTKKAVNCSLFSTMDHVCTHIDGMHIDVHKKASINGPKKRKWG